MTRLSPLPLTLGIALSAAACSTSIDGGDPLEPGQAMRALGVDTMSTMTLSDGSEVVLLRADGQLIGEVHYDETTEARIIDVVWRGDRTSFAISDSEIRYSSGDTAGVLDAVDDPSLENVNEHLEVAVAALDDVGVWESNDDEVIYSCTSSTNLTVKATAVFEMVAKWYAKHMADKQCGGDGMLFGNASTFACCTYSLVGCQAVHKVDIFGHEVGLLRECTAEVTY